MLAVRDKIRYVTFTEHEVDDPPCDQPVHHFFPMAGFVYGVCKAPIFLDFPPFTIFICPFLSTCPRVPVSSRMELCQLS
jgi:hypothetical protein